MRGPQTLFTGLLQVTILVKLTEAISVADREMLLFLHLSTRVTVNPPAMDMEILQWSSDLEGYAKLWAESCSWEYPRATNISERPLTLLGMNIAVISTESFILKENVPSVAMFYQMWMQNRHNFDYDLGICKEGYCGHYTQIVWAITEFIGCDRAYCESEDHSKVKGHVLVCIYSPPGRTAGGQPYQSLSSHEQYPLDTEPWIFDREGSFINSAQGLIEGPKCMLFAVILCCISSQ
ncbi:unnamed protein product [Mesocestoides corti]|uniref:SCP domain-containing protein n=1 Tax=Mesocestoides corti TaxID=53468 RepID=A0A0R3UES5_MESCO|nr:unnamed protein product [Mesocestoides corti]